MRYTNIIQCYSIGVDIGLCITKETYIHYKACWCWWSIATRVLTILILNKSLIYAISCKIVVPFPSDNENTFPCRNSSSLYLEFTLRRTISKEIVDFIFVSEIIRFGIGPLSRSSRTLCGPDDCIPQFLAFYVAFPISP